MKKILIYLSVLMLVGCQTAAEKKQIVWGQISAGNCSNAENLARQDFFHVGYLNWWYGTIELHCRKNKSKAIEFFKVGAISGGELSHLSVKALIDLGEKPPEPATRYISVPTPTPQPQQIIIQQQAPVIIPNPAACIQDGGSTYCPRYRR